MRERTFGPTVLAGLAGAALAAVAGTKDWARAGGDAAGVAVHASAKGSEAAPLVLALSLVALAAWGVVLVLRGQVRRAVAAVGALACAGALAAAGQGYGRARSDALLALTAKGATGGGHAAVTAWSVAAAVGLLVCLAAFVVAVLRAAAWPAMGSRYDAPGARTGREERPQTQQDLWRALDEGHDPTV